MKHNIGNGINNVGNGNLRIVSLISQPSLTLFDISNHAFEKDKIETYTVNIDEPNCLRMRAKVMQSQGFILIKNRLEIYENTSDIFRCVGDYFLLTLLQKGNAYVEDTYHTSSRNALRQNNLYFKSNIDFQEVIHLVKGEKIQYLALLLDKNFVRSLLRENYKELLQYDLYKQEVESRFTANLSIPLELNMYEAIKSLFALSFEEPVHRQLIHLKIIEILFLLKLNRSKLVDISPTDQYYIDRLKEIKSWIMINHHKEFTLRSLARNFGINELTLKAGFKELFGQTIRQFVIELRMEEAKSLIIKNTETVNEIAFKVGYKSVSHFIQTFKKHFGTTPHQYKNLDEN